jgi:hypothetical protein
MRTADVARAINCNVLRQGDMTDKLIVLAVEDHV